MSVPCPFDEFLRPFLQEDRGHLRPAHDDVPDGDHGVSVDLWGLGMHSHALKEDLVSAMLDDSVRVLGHPQRHGSEDGKPAADSEGVPGMEMHRLDDEGQDVALAELCLGLVVLRKVGEEEEATRDQVGMLHVPPQAILNQLHLPLVQHALHNVLLDRDGLQSIHQLPHDIGVLLVLPECLVDQRKHLKLVNISRGVKGFGGDGGQVVRCCQCVDTASYFSHERR
eukprot:754964-Hanusia_phi.AAC.3